MIEHLFSLRLFERAIGFIATMTIEFDETIIFWRGPAPWYFVPIPTEQSDDIKAIASLVTYGWGVIPVQVQIGETHWTTSLIPKDGRYLVPIRANIRKAENLEEGDMVSVTLSLNEFGDA